MASLTPGPDGGRVTVAAESIAGHAVLRMVGTLDALSYRSVRDRIVKAALEQPRSVIVDIDDLAVPRDSALAVFTAARWLIHEWPGVPLVVVCSQACRRWGLARNGICRYVAVHAHLGAALGAEYPQRCRRRARVTLPGDRGSAALARDFVATWLTRWQRPEMIVAAKVVVTELVQNVLDHTASRPRVRLETDGAIIVVAVEDDDPSPAKMTEKGPGTVGMGLRMVDAVSAGWRNASTANWKVVWAALDAPKRN
jgi:hypothetical protein